MIKIFKSADKTQLTAHFNVSEFKCKCGGLHDTKIDTVLAEKLEQLRTALDCSQIVINSGYRCVAHDKAVGGSGAGQHVNGCAADIVCYDKNNNKISSKRSAVLRRTSASAVLPTLAPHTSPFTLTHEHQTSGKAMKL